MHEPVEHRKEKAVIPMKGRIIALYCVLALLVVAPAARGGDDARSRALRIREVRMKINATIPLLRSRPDEAIARLKRLVRDYPAEKYIVLEKLGYAYNVAGKVDSAIAVYEEALEPDPINIMVARRLAELYLNRRENDKVEKLFSEVLRRSRSRYTAYKMMAEAKSAAGLYAEAIDSYGKAREAIGDSLAFALRMADLNKLLENRRGALEEYLKYLHTPRVPLRDIADKIEELMEAPGAEPSSILAFIEARSRSRDVEYRRQVLWILSTLYLGRGMPERALDAALRADDLPGATGKRLLEMVETLRRDCGSRRRSLEAECIDRCLRAVDVYLARHSKAVDAPKAHIMKAELLVEAASNGSLTPSAEAAKEVLNRAMGEYDLVIERYPGTRFAEKAMLGKGDLYFDYWKDYRSALEMYEKGAGIIGDFRLEFSEREVAALLALGEDELAKEHCASFMNSNDKELVEAGYYYMGVVLAFGGDPGGAKDTLTALAESNPASKYTNDAIELAWVIEEGTRKDPERLSEYLSALRAIMVGDSARAVEILSRFASSPPGTPFRPRALFKLGGIYAKRGDFEPALEVFRGFLSDYPDHSLAPEVERGVADVYETGLSDRKAALEAYENVLMRYPGYVFLDEVRAKVEELRRTEKLQ